MHLLLLLLASSTTLPDALAQRVHLYVDAFNARQIDTMLELAHDDIEWGFVGEQGLVIESRGKAALADGLRAYFDSCPSCRSEAGEMVVTGSRVSVVETASWFAKDGERRQSSLSVYEFDAEQRIRRVLYFDAEPPAQEQPIEHVIVCWLKQPGNAAQRTTVIEASQQLTRIPGVLGLRIGEPLVSDRPVVDDSYDVALIVTLQDEAALAAYPEHPIHRRLLEEVLRPVLDRYVVYDFRRR